MCEELSIVRILSAPIVATQGHVQRPTPPTTLGLLVYHPWGHD